MDEVFGDDGNQILVREYMRACLRVATGDSKLDSLGDDELRSTWLLGGKPKLSYGDWLVAMYPQEAPVEDVQEGPSDEDRKRANEQFLKSLKRKKEKNGADHEGEHAPAGSACDKQGDNPGAGAPAVSAPTEPEPSKKG